MMTMLGITAPAAAGSTIAYACAGGRPVRRPAKTGNGHHTLAPCTETAPAAQARARVVGRDIASRSRRHSAPPAARAGTGVQEDCAAAAALWATGWGVQGEGWAAGRASPPAAENLAQRGRRGEGEGMIQQPWAPLSRRRLLRRRRRPPKRGCHPRSARRWRREEGGRQYTPACGSPAARGRRSARCGPPPRPAPAGRGGGGQLLLPCRPPPRALAASTTSQ